MKFCLLALLAAAALVRVAPAESTVDSSHVYGYGANVGWLDFRVGSDSAGAVFGEFVCSGKLYAANCGWISLGNGAPLDGIQYTNTSGSDYGVNHLGDGRLRGLAWGANIGWVNFESTGNPRVDLLTGDLIGYVWSANVGWIALQTASAHVRTTHLAPGADTDGDGLPDAWELNYSDSLAILAAAPDSDGDGASNLAEYCAGTNPLDPSDALRITAMAHDSSIAETTLTWTSNATRLYRIQQCAALQTPPAWEFSAHGLIAPDAGSTTSRSTAAPSPAQSFFRVEAIRPLQPMP